jgi:hypothetical protein
MVTRLGKGRRVAGCRIIEIREIRSIAVNCPRAIGCSPPHPYNTKLPGNETLNVRYRRGSGFGALAICEYQE